DLRISSDRSNHAFCCLGGHNVWRDDVDHAVIGDVNFNASISNDFLNHLAAWADEITNPILGNLDMENPRSIFAQLARFRNGLIHDVEDVLSTFFGLSQSLRHNLL